MKSFEDNDMEMNLLPEDARHLRKAVTYQIPPGYFDDLADEILSKIHVPAGIEFPCSMPPANYFEGLAGSVLSNINMNQDAPVVLNDVEKELAEVDPFLATIPKTNVYAVPPGYFESFRVELPATQAAPVTMMRRPATWITYAAAAVVTGIIATGVFLYNNEQNTTTTDSHYSYSTNYQQALSKLPDSEITNYLDHPSPDADFITSVQDGNVTSTEHLFKVLLNNVSDREIQNYLKENNASDEKDIKGI